MSIVTPHHPDRWASYPVRRFTVAEYRRLGEVGVLTPEDRVELLEGWIVRKMNHNPPHDATVSVWLRALSNCLADDWMVRVQSAITTSDSEPEPDLAVVQGPERRYMRHHPTGSEIAAVIEVADSSLARDRNKCSLYARAAIPAYWIVNLADRQLEVFTDPHTLGTESMYRQQRNVMATETPPRLPMQTHSLADSVAALLP